MEIKRAVVHDLSPEPDLAGLKRTMTQFQQRVIKTEIDFNGGVNVARYVAMNTQLTQSCCVFGTLNDATHGTQTRTGPSIS